MGKVRVRYLETRRLKKGLTFYYCPPDDARAAGILQNCELGTDAGFAAARAEIYNRMLDQWRAGDRAPGFPAGSVGWLIREYRKSQWFKSRKPKTQQSYDADLNRIERYALASGKQLGGFLAAAITPPMADAMYQSLVPGGLRTANGIMVMAGMLWNFGMRYFGASHGIDRNPFAAMRLTRPKARATMWDIDQVDRFVAQADAQGAWSMGTAALICYLFTQRITDAITMSKSRWDGLALTVRQSKTGALVHVPALTEFRDRMAKMPQHDHVTLIVNERTGKPYDQYAFSDLAAEIRAAAGLPRHLQVRDLKRTGATETRQAGATTHELQATTGNSLETVQIYAIPTAPEAASAIRKRQRLRTKLRQNSKNHSK